MKKRTISIELLQKLMKNGVYQEITNIVRADPYLDMELRGDDGVMVYYRGGKLLTINERQGFIGLDEEYYPKEHKDILSPQIDSIFDYICKAKRIIDIHELDSKKKKLTEKEFQQRVVYENNRSANANNTDYFIADVEWADNNTLGGRADIVAFRWNHMEHRKRMLQLTLIEVKQGDGAIRTKDEKTPGLKKHYDDYLQLMNNKAYFLEVAEDMLSVLKQKMELGLINGIEKLFKRGESDISPDLEDSPDFIFLLANYHHYSTQLQEECASLPDDCKFYISSFMGYGLYKDFVFTKSKLKELFPMVFNK